MTTPTRTRGQDPAATTMAADRDRDRQATTDEAIARVDNAVITITARIDTVHDDAARSRLAGQLTVALTTLEQLAERLAAPAANSGEHTF